MFLNARRIRINFFAVIIMERQKHLILLLSTQRSGSTWLADIINQASNEDLAVYGELLLPQPKVWDIGNDDIVRFMDSSFSQGSRLWALQHYLDNIYAKTSTSLLFKLMYSDIRRYPEIMFYILRHPKRVKIIHLIRKNYLNTIISLERLRQARVVHVHAGDGNANVQIALDVTTLESSIGRLQRKVVLAQRLVTLLPNPSITVHYEALLAGNQDEIDRLKDFLGLKADFSALESGLMRIAKGGQAQSLSNYVEVRAILQDTKYEYLVE